MGGDFWSAALAAGVGHLGGMAMSKTGLGKFGQAAGASVLSGTTSVISGGSFFEGAVTGLIVHMCNRGMHGEKEPSRIDWNASGDEVYQGLSEWIDYLGEGGGFYLKKDESGKYYSIHDVFCNLPQAPNARGLHGKTQYKTFTLSNGDYFDVGLKFYSKSVFNNGATLIKSMSFPQSGKSQKGDYMRVNFTRGTVDRFKKGHPSLSVFTVTWYGERLYGPVVKMMVDQLSY